MTELILAVSLPAALAVGTVPFAVLSLRRQRADRAVAAVTIEWPPTFAEIVEANGGIPPEIRTHASDANFRHNVHCPRCGRFAKKDTDLPGLISCKQHGLVFKVPTHPMTGEIYVVPAVHRVEHAQLQAEGAR